MQRRHHRTINRDDGMYEEHKGPVAQPDEDGERQSELINVRRGRPNKKEEEFDEAELSSDYEDQLDALRQDKRRRREETAAKENRRLIKSTYLPSSSKKMSACITCSLVLNREKWRKLGQCPNCP